MAQPPLVTIREWQRKSSQVYSQNKDALISAVNKGFEAMAAVLTKDSDPQKVQGALRYLNVTRSIALHFDEAKDDSLRDLVYGLLESLQVSLNEWNEERNQRKDTGEIHTQTEFTSVDSLKIAELEKIVEGLKMDVEKWMHESESARREADAAQKLAEEDAEKAIEKVKKEERKKRETLERENCDLKNQVTWLGMKLQEMENAKIPDSSLTNSIEPREESIHIHQSLPMDNQISDSELMRDENLLKEEEMDNENNALLDSVAVLEQALNATRSLPFNWTEDPADFSQVLPHDNRMSPLIALRDEMDLKGEEEPNDDVIQPSDVMDYQMNSDNDHGEEDDLLANDLMEKEEKSMVSPTDNSKIYAELGLALSNSPPDSDDDDATTPYGTPFPTVKKNRSHKGEDKSEARIKKRSKKNATDLKCPECEFRTRTVSTWVLHLRKKHSTTPTLAGLALLCDCGTESLSANHSHSCNHGNTTVIRKREGPIRRVDDAKTTPKCLVPQCEKYPKTACGYAAHLTIRHKSSLTQNGVYLMCSCGLKVRSINNSNHLNECDPHQFTLHKLDDE